MAKFGQPAAAEDLERVNAFKAAIFESAKMYHLRPALVAAIMSRETRALPKFFIGDNGRGCGPMQVDVGTAPELCERYKSGDVGNEAMITAGCKILHEKFEALRPNRHLQSPEMLEKGAVAAYNCGQGNVARALSEGAEIDRFTTGQNYSWDVLQRAQFFAGAGYAI